MLRIQFVGMLLFITLIPIFNVAGIQDMRMVQEHFFQFAVMSVMVLFIRNIWMTLFFLLNVVLLCFNRFECGDIYVMNVFFAICLFWASRAFFRKFSFLDFTGALVCVGILNMFWMILQKIGIDPLYVGASNSGDMATGWHFRDTTALMGLKAAVGIFYAILIPIFARRNMILALTLLFPIWVCQSSAAIVAGAVALLFYAWQMQVSFSFRISYWWRGWKKKLIRVFWLPVLFVMMVGMSTYYIAVKDYRDDPQMLLSRFFHWHSVIKSVIVHPFGYGPDSFRNFTPSKKFLFLGDEERRAMIGNAAGGTAEDGLRVHYYHPDTYKMRHGFDGVNPKSPNLWDNPHNEYIHVLFQYGFPGIILLIGFIRQMWLGFKHTRKDPELVIIASCIIVFLVAALTQFPFHLARLGGLFPVLLGALYAKIER